MKTVRERSHVFHNHEWDDGPVSPSSAATLDPIASLPPQVARDVGLLGGRQYSGATKS